MEWLVSVREVPIFENQHPTWSFLVGSHTILYSISKCCFINFKYSFTLLHILLIASWNREIRRFLVYGTSYKHILVLTRVLPRLGPVYEKDNSEFNPVKLRLKIDLVSHPTRVEGLLNTQWKNLSFNKEHEKKAAVSVRHRIRWH